MNGSSATPPQPISSHGGITFAGVLGAIFGSFLNVVVYRLPRHESLVTPASHCPRCGDAGASPTTTSRSSRGCCCAATAAAAAPPISPRYPLVEALTAALCVGAVLAHHSAADIALSVALILLVVPAALIDLEHRIIPNRITALGAVLALVLGLALDPAGEPARLIAGAAAGGFLLLAALAYPGGMGMGDVKLAGVMGLFLGAAVAPALLIALIAGVLVGVGRDRPQGRARRTQDRGPVRSLPRARRARRGFRRAATRRCLRQPLPPLKRRALDADTHRAGDPSAF